MMNIYIVIFITLIAALIASVSQLSYKRSLKERLSLDLKSILVQFKKRGVIIGLGGYFASLAVYLYALSNAPLSIVYPTFASTFIFITVFSAFFLKERINTMRTIGIVVIFFGILLVTVTL